ncbi:hypothetical protein [Solidesulfovibrio sp.]
MTPEINLFGRNTVQFFLVTPLLLLLLGGCGAPVHKIVTSDIRSQMMRDLQEGNLVLTSNNVNASFYFISSWRGMAAAYNAQQWEKLAELVMATGHEIDVAYYFLGAAAEKLGYTGAALRYYQKAAQLYTDRVYDHHCRDLLSNQGCPINLARVIPARIANVEGLLRAQEAAAALQRARDAQAERKQTRSASRQGRSSAGKTQAAKPDKAVASSPTSPESVPFEPIPEQLGNAGTPAVSPAPSQAPAAPTATPGQDKVRITMPPVDQEQAPPPPAKTPAKAPVDDYS